MNKSSLFIEIKRRFFKSNLQAYIIFICQEKYLKNSKISYSGVL